MRFKISVEEIQSIICPKCISGHFEGSITKISDLRSATAGSISFLGNKKYADQVVGSKASLLLLPENFDFSPAVNQLVFFCADPSAGLARICQHIENLDKNTTNIGIHPFAVIHATARLGQNISIGPHAIIEENVTIGQNTVINAGVFIGRHSTIGHDTKIFPNVSIMAFSQIGNYVILHAGVVLGADGFGFISVDGHHEKIPQIGNVILEDYVDIGANTTVDRARFASTIIGQGTKIDNLVQIGHNVKIGKNCIIVSQVGIAGSTTIGDNVTIGGQVGIAGHLHIADGAQIWAQSGVTKDVESGAVLLGSPATSYREAVQQFACIAKLPKILKKITH